MFVAVSLDNYQPLILRTNDKELYLSVLALSEEYMLPRLKAQLQLQLLPLVNDDCCVDLLASADLYSAPALRAACVQYLLKHFSRLSVTKPDLLAQLEAYPRLLMELTRAAIVGRNKREREWETPPYDSTAAGAAAEEHPDAPPARRRRLTVRTTITSMHHNPHTGAPAIESRAGSFN